VFKGREARLNRAIFQSLALNGHQTIFDLDKKSRTFGGLRNTHYGNVREKVRALEKLGYLKQPTSGKQRRFSKLSFAS
jgi:hypothetical protein